MEQFIPQVYDELRRLARHFMQRERPDHTLQPTALVNEAYLRLAGANVSGKDRSHFVAVIARQMRLLVDHARTQQRVKRDGGNRKVALEDAAEVPLKPAFDLLALDEATAVRT